MTQLTLGIEFPPDLVHEAACLGERGVMDDPRYQALIGEPRRQFWRAVSEWLGRKVGPWHGPIGPTPPDAVPKASARRAL